MRNKIRSIAMLAGVLAMLEATGWAQCVMCGTALASSPEGQALAGSFRIGIGILLVAPYLILGAIGYAIYRAYRKKAVQRNVIARELSTPHPALRATLSLHERERFDSSSLS
jgi:hypothetical protein